ncbi:MAG: hypothetical protein AB8B72_01575 [Crocinitomicaceae bacterium]
MKVFLSFFFIAVFTVLQSSSILALKTGTFEKSTNAQSDSIEVLKILENKCNICHQKKKKVVFTFDNMSTYHLAIENQVFIKKRMPKGKDFKLTKAEEIVLLNWIRYLKD